MPEDRIIKGVIFDLDGVLVTTDDCHYRAWKRMADEEGIPFDRRINQRLRGVSRMESLEIILENANRVYSESDKKAMAERKNAYYVDMINSLEKTAILPGATVTLIKLREAEIRMAIGSSSRNATAILNRLGLTVFFDAVADGNQIRHSKPNPEVFLLAAEKLGLTPAECLVVEDADAGVEAAVRAGMRVLAVGAAKENPQATLNAESLETFNLAAYLRRRNRIRKA